MKKVKRLLRPCGTTVPEKTKILSPNKRKTKRRTKTFLVVVFLKRSLVQAWRNRTYIARLISIYFFQKQIMTTKYSSPEIYRWASIDPRWRAIITMERGLLNSGLKIDPCIPIDMRRKNLMQHSSHRIIHNW